MIPDMTRFEKHCQGFWDKEKESYHNCNPEEHYIPTLMAVLERESEMDCDGGGIASTDWSDVDSAHPRAYTYVCVCVWLCLYIYTYKIHITPLRHRCVSIKLFHSNQYPHAAMVGLGARGHFGDAQRVSKAHHALVQLLHVGVDACPHRTSHAASARNAVSHRPEPSIIGGARARRAARAGGARRAETEGE